jgi:hypothetical protein
MKLYFAIYLLGSVVSLVMTLITLSLSKTASDELMDIANNKLSERLNQYERINFLNPNIYCAVNFLMSWFQVAMFLYSYLPSRFYIKINFYRFISAIFIWIHTKTGAIAHAVVNKHNDTIRDYNTKHGIKNE